MIRTRRTTSNNKDKNDKEQLKTKSKSINKENIVTKRITRNNRKQLTNPEIDKQNEICGNEENKEKYVPKIPIKVYGDNSSFFDSIYHAIKKDREEKEKAKRKTQREKLKSVKNVEISTPIKRVKRKCELYFDVSPISMKNQTLELPSLEKYDYMEPVPKELKVLTIDVDESNRLLDNKNVDKEEDKLFVNVPEIRVEEIIEIEASLKVPEIVGEKTVDREDKEISIKVPEIVVDEIVDDEEKRNSVKSSEVNPSQEMTKQKIVKFVDPPNEKEASEITKTTIHEGNVTLKPGKWRQSLVKWRKSHNPSSTFVRTSRRFVALFPIRTDPGVMDRYKKNLHETLQKSVLWEQSDEGRLQAELSILDSSVECSSIHKSYALQRKTSQRETSVFKKSSIFYGLTSPLIDVDILSGLSAQQVVLRRCRQQEPLLFDDIYSESQLPNCKKIGEGVYGEVFMYKPADDDPVVLKIIPIEGDLIVNGGPQKRFSEILSEIVIAEELSGLSNGKENKTNGFVKIKRVQCVKGAYPQHLLDAWEIFNDSSLRGSENDNPDIFDDDQLYIVFEQYNAGIDLEAFIFKNAEEAFSIFVQVALTLAVAENKFEFEHRDLHWGNVLIARTNEKTLKYHVDGKVYEVPSCGVKCTIIDFTLSRMIYDGAVIYDNLAKDQELFESSGDYQFDIYRLMRYRLENDFKRYDPYTNLLWLHYLIDKLIDGARYKYSKSDKHKSAVNKMMQLRDTLLEENQSASDFVKSLKN